MLAEVMLLSLRVALLAVAAGAACPSTEWKQWAGMCYWASDYTLNWRNVDRVCDDMFPGATSVSIHDMDLEAFLSVNLLNYQRAWIGLRRSSPSESWTWSDGSAYDFSMWGSGQPNNEAESCAAINLTYGTWGDFNCDSYYTLFMCQIHS